MQNHIVVIINVHLGLRFRAEYAFFLLQKGCFQSGHTYYVVSVSLSHICSSNHISDNEAIMVLF